MAYNNPTKHEMRIGPAMQRIAKKVQKLFVKETGGEVDFILIVSSSAARRMQSSGAGVPVGMYVANMDRVSSALSMAEMLAKWQITGAIPPLSELEDAAGNKLEDILHGFDPKEDHNTDEGTEQGGGGMH